MNDFQRRVKEIRCARKLTLSELSVRSGVAKGHLSRIESEENVDPRISTVERIACALGVDPGVLAYGDLTQNGHLARIDG